MARARLTELGKERSRQIWPIFRRWDPKGLAVEGDGRSPVGWDLGQRLS